MLGKEHTVMVLIDVQGRLALLMHEKEALFENLRRLILGMQALRIPVIWVEQNPLKLGPTIPELSTILHPQVPIAKMSFSCCGESRFLAALEASGRKQVLAAGIETHVCVYQTVRGLVERGFETEVVADAVSSRTAENRRIGLDRIRACGAAVTSTEMALFELLSSAEDAAFRDIQKIVK